MNNKFDMMKYLFDVFELYFLKIMPETQDNSSSEMRDSLSCPSVKKQSLCLSISGEEGMLVLEKNNHENQEEDDCLKKKSSVNLFKRK